MKKRGILHQECVKSAWGVQQLERQINGCWAGWDKSLAVQESKQRSQSRSMKGGLIMATTRIMPLHIGKGRTESQAISDIIDYAANPQKTDNGRL